MPAKLSSRILEFWVASQSLVIRASLQALLDYLEGGQKLGDFLGRRFSTVSRETAIAALEEAKALCWLYDRE